jgi:hypothetical protein
MQNKLVVALAATSVIAAIIVWALAAQFSQPTSLSPRTEPAGSIDLNAAEASEKEAWEELGLPYDPNEGEPTEASAEDIQRAQNEIAIQQELDRIDAKERATIAAVMADERVKEHVKGALQVQSDFVPSEYRENTDMDKVTLTVTSTETVEGNWQSSYTSKLTGMFALEIEVKDGTIVSIEKKPLSDLGGEYTYSDAEKEMIKTALQDPAVLTALKEKEDAGKNIAITIRSEKLDFPAYNCPMNQCALIFLREVNSHATLEVWLNTAEGKVVKTEAADGW